jgi:thioredoxin-like negative regulator of GroEL
VIFIKVDVDELQQTATREGVTAMPTFFFYKRGEKVDYVTLWHAAINLTFLI